MFLYDGLKLLAEVDGTGAGTDFYARGEGIDEPLVWYNLAAGGIKRFIHTDERGSVVALSDDSGNPVSINSYDEYGIPGSGNAGRFQYTGQMWLGGVGLYYYKNRFYSPTLGRFLQTDPIGTSDNANLYAYVGNDPVNYIDPMGLTDQAYQEPIVVSACQNGGTPPNCYEQPGNFISGGAPASGPGEPGCRGECSPINVIGRRRHSKPQIVKQVVKDVICALGTAADAVKFSLDTAGDAMETALDAVHDVVFPPACAAPCVTPGQARVALSNREFRRWFHQTYKQQQGISGGGRDNPDMTPEEVMDAYDEWKQLQKKFKPRC
jgi:RHS repeat-associated protein